MSPRTARKCGSWRRALAVLIRLFSFSMAMCHSKRSPGHPTGALFDFTGKQGIVGC